MNLVVQGNRLASTARQSLAKLTDAGNVEPIDDYAWRFDVKKKREHIAAEVARFCTAAALDWAWIPKGRRLNDFGLFITDMDSTLINIE